MSTARSISSASSASSSGLGASQDGTSLARLNQLLHAFGIDLSLPKLSLTPPSLLLAVLEAILGERLDSPSSAARASRDQRDRLDVCDALAGAINIAAGQRHLAWTGVDTRRLEAGKRREVGLVVELLWSLAEKVEVEIRSTRAEGEDAKTDAGEPSRTATLLWPQQRPLMLSTPLPQPPRARPESFSPAPPPSLSRSTISSAPPRSISTRPTSAMSNTSSTSRSLLVAMSATSPPPLTPTKRSTLALLSRADAIAPPPRFILPPELKNGSYKPVQQPLRKPVARRAARMEEDESPAEASYLNGKRKETSPPSECSCEGHGAPDAVESEDAHEAFTPAEPARQPKARTKARQPSRDQPQPSTSSSPSSPPRRPSKLKSSKPHVRSVDAPTQPRRAKPQPQPTFRAKAVPARSLTTSAQFRSFARTSHLVSGYHSVVGDSEIEAFEANKRRVSNARVACHGDEAERAHVGVREASVGLQVAEGWAWLPPDELEREANPPLLETQESRDEDEYTRMLMEEKARLLSQLRDLKLQQLAIVNGAGGEAEGLGQAEQSEISLDSLAREISSRWTP